jgi:hypothetical protein
MIVKRKGFPAAFLNRVVFWAVIFGCMGAIISIQEASDGAYLDDIILSITLGVSLGGLIGWGHYLAYKKKTNQI